MNEFYSYFGKPVMAIITVVLYLVFSTKAHTQVEALATCDGIVTDEIYAIEVKGLSVDSTYDIIVDGVLSSSITGVSSFVSGSISFKNGLDTTLVMVIVSPAGSPDTLEPIIVHEALCVDADNDGDMDFNEASCDYTQTGPDWGTIVSTVAPYNGENVYLYFLTDTTGEIGASIDTSTTGHFTGLVNGDYKVYAYTFLTYGDALSFVDSLELGDDLDDWTAGSDPICYNYCGDAEYTIDCVCPISIDSEPQPLALCEGFSDSMIIVTSLDFGSPIDMFPEPNSMSYQWQSRPLGGSFVDMGGETDSILLLNNVTFAMDSNEYRAIITLTVDGTTVCTDTSAATLLEVYEEPVMASTLDATVCSGEATGIIFSVTTGLADSFNIISISSVGLIGGASNDTIGITGDSSIIADDIWTNIGENPVDVTYQVTAISGDGCISDTMDIVLTVDPEPSVDDDIVVDVCSGEQLGITLPSSANVSIDSFVVSADVPAGFIGTPTEGSTTDTDYISQDTFINLTGLIDTVTYTITPYSADDCEGEDFTIKVPIKPEPSVDDLELVVVCSDEIIGVTLPSSDGSGSPMAIDSFDISAVVGSSLSGTATEGTGITLVDTISNDVFTNIGSSLDSVIYTFTPYAGGCIGDDFSIVVRVTPEPLGVDSLLTICSDENVMVNLDDLITNGMTGVSWSWIALDNTGVTGELTVEQTGSIINNTLSNTTDSSATVIYYAIPTASASDQSCVGDTITISVTVDPEPVYNDSTAVVCSGEQLNLDLSDYIESSSVSAIGYTYSVSSTDETNVPAGSARTDTTSTNITDTYENLTSSSVDITYTITPYSSKGCEGDEFEIVITVDPEPVLADDLDGTVCSDSPIGLILTLEPGSVATDSFELISINERGLTVISQTSVGYITADSLANDVYENTGSSSDSVTYQVASISVGGCRGDTISITITVDPEVTVDAGIDETICSTAEVELDGDISGGSTSGTWSSSGTGSFTGGTSYASATAYVPSAADKQSGSVTLTLTSSDPEGECDQESDSITITINSVECGTFPWTGNE